MRKSIEQAAADAMDFSSRESQEPHSGEIEYAAAVLNDNLPKIMTASGVHREIALAGMNRDKFISIILARVASLSPSLGIDNSENQHAIGFLRSAIGNAFDRIRCDPQINTYVYEAMLGSLDRIEYLQNELLEGQEHIALQLDKLGATQLAKLDTLTISVEKVLAAVGKANKQSEGLSEDDLRRVLQQFGYGEHATREQALDLLADWAKTLASSRARYDTLLLELAPFVDETAPEADIAVPDLVTRAFKLASSLNAEYSERSLHPNALPRSVADLFTIVSDRYREMFGNEMEMREITASGVADNPIIRSMILRHRDGKAIVVVQSISDRALFRLTALQAAVEPILEGYGSRSDADPVVSLREQIIEKGLAYEKRAAPIVAEVLERTIPELIALELIFPLSDREKFYFGSTRGDWKRSAVIAADIYGLPLAAAEFCLSPIVMSYLRRFRDAALILNRQQS